MIQTFEEWFRQSEFYERVFPAMALEIGIQVWHARDAEIADLKRQLRQALAQVEIVDRALGDPGNTSSKVALHAYVQETVDPLLDALQRALDRGFEYCNGFPDGSGYHDDCHACVAHKELSAFLAANRAKVAATPADPPKEK